MNEFTSKTVEEQAQELIEEILDGMEDGICDEDSLTNCMDVLEDGGFLGTYFSTVIPQRKDYGPRKDYDDACEAFENSEDGKHVQLIVEVAYDIIETKMQDLAA